MARVLLTGVPWTYREVRHPDGLHGVHGFLARHVFTSESTINGKMPFWALLYLAAWLRREGHEVQYLEPYGTDEAAWWRAVETFRPDVVGFNSVTCVWPKTQSFLARLKARWPDVITALGGAHVNVAKDAVLNECAALDVAVYGEGELTMTDLLARIDAGSRDFGGVTGCAWRGPDGAVHKEARRALIADLDQLPFPARDLIRGGERWNPRLNIYNRPENTVIFSGRGCPLTCASCHLPAIGSLQFRIRSPEHVFAEMLECESRWGITDFGFYDHFGIFAGPEEPAKRLCELIIAAGKRWTFTVTFWSFDFSDELLDLMRRAGCWRVDTVLISAVEKNLRTATMGSPLTVARMEDGVHRIVRAGMEAAARFSLGIDGETVDDARQTIDWATKLPLEWAFFTPVNPVFGSRLWRQLDKGDRFLADERSMNIFHVFYEPNAMSRAELKGLQREAYRRFYGRPGFVLGKAAQARHPEALRRNLTVASHLGRHLVGL